MEQNPIRTDIRTSTLGNEIMTTNTEYVCGKVCENPRGLKIHQAKMKCVQIVQASQHTGTTPGETQEEQGQESPHRAQSLQMTHAPLTRRASEHQRVRWPQAHKEMEWSQFDEDTDAILEAAAKGGAHQHLQTMTTIIVSLGAERFGLEEDKTAKRQPSKEDPPDTSSRT